MGNSATERGFPHRPGFIDMYVLVVVCQVRESINHLLVYRQPRGETYFSPNLRSKFRNR